MIRKNHRKDAWNCHVVERTEPLSLSKVSCWIFCCIHVKFPTLTSFGAGYVVEMLSMSQQKPCVTMLKSTGFSSIGALVQWFFFSIHVHTSWYFMIKFHVLEAICLPDLCFSYDPLGPPPVFASLCDKIHGSGQWPLLRLAHDFFVSYPGVSLNYCMHRLVVVYMYRVLS